MKTLMDPVTEADTRFRLRQLQVTTPPRWGKTTAARVVLHLADVFSFPAGGTTAAPPDAGLLAKYPLLRRWHTMSFPCADRRALVVEGDQPPDLAAWKGQAQACQDACTRFVTRLRSPGGPPLAPHPVFGPLSGEEWAQLLYLHVDHHLRQFGV